MSVNPGEEQEGPYQRLNGENECQRSRRGGPPSARRTRLVTDVPKGSAAAALWGSVRIGSPLARSADRSLVHYRKNRTLGCPIDALVRPL